MECEDDDSLIETDMSKEDFKLQFGKIKENKMRKERQLPMTRLSVQKEVKLKINIY